MTFPTLMLRTGLGVFFHRVWCVVLCRGNKSFFLSDFQSVAHLSITDCLGAHFARVQAGTFFVLHSAQHIFVLSSGLSYLPPQTASWTMKRQGERRLVARSLVREKHGILLMLAAARATELPGFF